jgi:hypothetical protein
MKFLFHAHKIYFFFKLNKVIHINNKIFQFFLISNAFFIRCPRNNFQIYDMFPVSVFRTRIIVEYMTKRTNVTYYILRKRVIYYLILHTQKKIKVMYYIQLKYEFNLNVRKQYLCLFI